MLEKQTNEMDMESESFENQLGQPEPDKDHSKAVVTEQNEKDMNHQYATPYSLHPRLQPPAHIT